jgi:hypothetical protein
VNEAEVATALELWLAAVDAFKHAQENLEKALTDRLEAEQHLEQTIRDSTKG